MGAAAVGAGVGAGLGLLKQAEQERQFKAQSDLAATQTQLSGLGTGIQAGQIGAAPSAFDNLLAGTASGAALGGNVGQSMFQQQAQQRFLQEDDPAKQQALASAF